MKNVFERAVMLCALALMLMNGAVAEDLRIIGEDKLCDYLACQERITITRQMTPCAKNKGWLQPLVPSPGIVPVHGEVLNAIGDPNMILVDMRTEEWFLDATIPGSVNIPYAEVAAMRMDELGCSKSDAGWDCSNASNVVGFCNGRFARKVPPR